MCFWFVCLFKQKTAYERRISDWSSDVCSSDRVAIQTALNLTSPIIPKSLIGFTTRQSVILEFAPTFVSIIMAGKVGSYITSSIGTMRVTEQIDALEIGRASCRDSVCQYVKI